MTNTHWMDVLGGYVSAVEIMREWWRDAHDAITLGQWIERQSRELWTASGEHVDEDWDALAAQVRRDALHGDWNLDDVAAGWANIVRCPDCGAMEIWSVAESADHGHCRAAGGRCEVCAD